jgi:hypothetical protein
MAPGPPEEKPKPLSIVGEKPEDAILVLIDVVEYTPQSVKTGAAATRRFDEHLKDELFRRAQHRGFHYIPVFGGRLDPAP